MSRAIKIIFALFAFVIISSCTNDNDKFQRLLIKDYHKFHLSIDREKKSGDFKEYLDSLACDTRVNVDSNKGLPYIYFDCKKNQLVNQQNPNSLKIGLYLYPCHHTIFDIKYRNVLLIQLDSSKNLLIENKHSHIDSIGHYMEKHILNFGENPSFSETPNKALIDINICNNLRMKDIEPILKNVIKSYKSILALYLKTKHNTTLKELSDIQIKQISEEFRLNMWINTQLPPLPPPPPVINKEILNILNEKDDILDTLNKNTPLQTIE